MSHKQEENIVGVDVVALDKRKMNELN